MTKNIYCIRHGLSLHNKLYHKHGSNTFYDPDYIDTPLLPEGREQAINLASSWTELDKIDLVIVSPLKRTLETAYHIFKNSNKPIIAFENCREFPLGLHTCNKRSNKEELELLYPDIDFTNLKDNKDTLWNPCKEETLASLNERIEVTKQFLLSRKETNIALVNHSSFIGQMKDKHIKYLDNGEEELKHCFPYKIVLDN